MINTIYIEKEISNHYRTKRILTKFPKKHIIHINHYGEIFNKKKQNFRLQKKNQSLIIAKKSNQFVIKTPENSFISKNRLNFYFSHMYNCLYDCKYCYLQGLFASSNYVIFINYEDFFEEIKRKIIDNKNKKITFFSGYDCDSLALEKITGFLSEMLPEFKKHEDAELEIRTKSASLYPFNKINPANNLILAYSLLPENISYNLDIKTPSIKKRLQTIFKLSKIGWKIGLRFDPLIFYLRWKEDYSELFSIIKNNLSPQSIHSITFGSLRFSKKSFKIIEASHPNEILFSSNFVEKNNKVFYPKETTNLMFEFCKDHFKNFVSEEVLFYEEF